MAEPPLPPPEREAATIKVPGRGGEPPAEGSTPVPPPGVNPELKMDEKEKERLAKMTAEDRALLEALELAVERLSDSDASVVAAALEIIRKELRSATSSMTSVPKPLKYLGPHYNKLRDLLPKFESSTVQSGAGNHLSLADILSVLSLTVAVPGERRVLSYKLKGNTNDISPWGSEYVRSLSGEIGQEYAHRVEAAPEKSSDEHLRDLISLIRVIVPYNMQHNAEVDAVDLLLETEQLPLLLQPGMVDTTSQPRVCLYLLKCSEFLGDSEDTRITMKIAHDLYLAHSQYPDALRTALLMGGAKANDLVRHVFSECTDAGVHRQMCYILGRHKASYIARDDDLDALIGNRSLRELYHTLARDLDVVEPKLPDDVYKTHLTGAAERPGAAAHAAAADSARANLASTYVNAFLNAGFTTDKLMTTPASDWVYKVKDHGMIAAAASLGMIKMWSDDDITELDKYTTATDDNILAGAYLGMALTAVGTRNLDIDPICALLVPHIEDGALSGHNSKLTVLFGLGLTYAGSDRSDISEKLTPFIVDPSNSIELASVASLALGMVHVGHANEVVAALIADRLMELNDTDASQAITRHMILGLGLLFLGQGDAADAILEVVNVITHDIGKQAAVVIKSCAYAGTGNVLQIQALLRICAEHPEAEDKEKAEKEAAERERVTKERAAAAAGPGRAGGAAAAAAASAAAGGRGAEPAAAPVIETAGKYLHQSLAVIGLALVAMGEELSVDMASRMADHLLQYGDTAVRRTVPIALALLHLSDPDYTLTDSLSRLSHDPNPETSQAAIFAMGLIGAGTNNSRIAGLLRTLAQFYKTEPNHLFIVRIAQGLLHMGKGLLTINPIHSDRMLLSPVALSGVLSTLFLMLDVKTSVHTSKWHFLLYSLATAMYPRFMITVKEDGAFTTVDVRVGQAVETVGQAGKPKTITGFQTHTAPVLLGVKDRSELVDDEFLSLTNVMEGVVVVRPNPAFKGKPKKRTTTAAASAASATASS